MPLKTRSPIPAPLLREAAGIMRAIAHPLRLRILELLEEEGEAGVSALCEGTGAAQPSVSQQLARMRLEGVLAARREGNQVIYRVARPEVLGVLGCIRRMERRPS
jgi:ArsR family transcriptional regulator